MGEVENAGKTRVEGERLPDRPEKTDTGRVKIRPSFPRRLGRGYEYRRGVRMRRLCRGCSGSGTLRLTLGTGNPVQPSTSTCRPGPERRGVASHGPCVSVRRSGTPLVQRVVLRRVVRGHGWGDGDPTVEGSVDARYPCLRGSPPLVGTHIGPGNGTRCRSSPCTSVTEEDRVSVKSRPARGSPI